MQVYDQRDFSTYANPILHKPDSVLYDAFATFTEDSTLYNYTLINGIAHSTSTPYSSSQSGDTATTVSCFDAESSKLPAINSIASAINDASASSSDIIACDTGKLFKVTLKALVSPCVHPNQALKCSERIWTSTWSSSKAPSTLWFLLEKSSYNVRKWQQRAP
ncbi:hypothetical protein V7S43_016926 [Phytophthora oleae]|uniref:Uncharacterized protein n=1 Tax=Phytophthora oleae TaxID=2107226 RepID=A0ABD3EUG6_9STRA